MWACPNDCSNHHHPTAARTQAPAAEAHAAIAKLEAAAEKTRDELGEEQTAATDAEAIAAAAKVNGETAAAAAQAPRGLRNADIYILITGPTFSEWNSLASSSK